MRTGFRAGLPPAGRIRKEWKIRRSRAEAFLERVEAVGASLPKDRMPTTAKQIVTNVTEYALLSIRMSRHKDFAKFAAENIVPLAYEDVDETEPVGWVWRELLKPAQWYYGLFCRGV